MNNNHCFTQIKQNFKLYPSNIALSSPAYEISYAELEAFVDDSAVKILSHGVIKGDVIAIISENSPEFVIFVLAVWKIGGIIVLLDASLPLRRIEHMLTESKAKLLISYQKRFLEMAPDNINKQLIVPSATNPTAVDETLHDLAYVFFTSGTSGMPKGILASHKSLQHFLNWQSQTFHIGSEDRCLQLTRLSFDVVLRSVFTGLISGAGIVFPNLETEVSDVTILKINNEAKITYIHVVPSLMKTWLLQLHKPLIIPDLKYIFFAGEKLDRVLVSDVRRLIPNPDMELINLYGPSETVLAKCYLKVPLVLDKAYILPVGKPINDTFIHIVNNQQCITQPQVEGEIVIETEYKSIGYLDGRETFRLIPGTDRFGYYTGDTGYIQANGNLLVLGRNDDQIKINGVRIEVSEIDNVITNLRQIKQAATYYAQDKQQLICYTVADSELDLSDLHEELLQQLPSEMMPHQFIQVPHLLYNTSGKLDRRNLPSLDGVVLQRRTNAQLIDSKLGRVVLDIFINIFAREDINLNTSFYALGGNSLKAALVINKLEKQLKYKPKVSAVFKHATPLELANYLTTLSLKESAVKKITHDIFKLPLIAEQLSLATHQVLHKKSPDYNIGYAFELKANIKEYLIHALKLTVAQIKLLNSAVQISDNQFQYKYLVREYIIDDVMLNSSSDVMDFLNNIYSTALDIEQQLFRAVILNHRGALYLCVIFHHTISDGESSQLFFKMLQNNCNQINNICLTNELHYINSTTEETKQFWKQYLATYHRPNCFFDLPYRNTNDIAHGTTIIKIISAHHTRKVQALVLDEGMTEFSLYLGLFAFLVSRFSNSEHIMVGVPFSSRQHYNAEHEFGCFVKTLPIIGVIDEEQSLNKLCHVIKDTVVDILDNYFYGSLFELIDEFNLSKTIDKLNLYDLFFSYDNYFLDEITIDGCNAKRIDLHNHTSKFPLSLMLNKMSNEDLRIELEFDNHRFSNEVIIQFLNSYTMLIESVNQIIQQKLCNIVYADLPEYKVDGKAITYNSNENIMNYIYQHVLTSPDICAIKYGIDKLSYRELWQQIVYVSHILQQRQIKETKIIAVAVPKGIDFIVYMCAIYHAGLIYMPIDLNLPEQRVFTILDDAKPDLLICHQEKEAFFSNYPASCISINNLNSLLDNTCSGVVNLDDAAYLLYTSGTTGKPKGVLQTYRTISNLICHQLSEFVDLRPNSIVGQSAAMGFDVSIQEMTFALANGHTLLIIDQNDKMSPHKLWNLIEYERISLIFIPPAVLQLLSEYLPPHLSHIPQYIVVAGEALHITPHIRKLRKQYQFNLVNHYGPTETHVITSYILPSHLEQWVDLPSIGTAVSNCGYIILDKNMQVVPPGVIGELYCYGDNLALGYYNNPELSATKFINYTLENDIQRLYKTGDLVRQLMNGNLEYLGRSDLQIKIRGFRVELEEIENSLMAYPGITQCLVMVKELSPGNQSLIGYYSAHNKIESNLLRESLAAQLPEYMLPTAFVEIDIFPLTVNGKIDRQALPEPKLISNITYVAPSNAIEEELAYIWGNILKLDVKNISILDDFFQLGGNSLLLIRLINQINLKCSSTLNINSFFSNRTIKKLALYLESTDSEQVIIQPAPIQDKYPLSFAQQRLWFIEQFNDGSNAYNIPLLFKLNSETYALAIHYSINMIVERHEILRTLIKQDDEGNGYQQVTSFMEQAYACEELPDQAYLDNKLRLDVNHVFALNSELPIKVNFYKVAKIQYVSIVIHHIAFDGWSVDIFMHELIVGYKYWQERLTHSDSFQHTKYLRQLNLSLPKLDIQYKDFALWQKKYLDKERLTTQLEYWHKHLAGYETLNLLTDKSRPLQVSYQGKYVDFKIPFTSSQGLRNIAGKLNVSLYSVLLSAYYVFLSAYTRQKDIVIGTSAANRNYAQLENIIGFFVNNMAIRCQIDPEQSITDFISHVGKLVLEAQLHQDIPFEQIVEHLKVAKDTSRHPIFQVGFEVQSFGSSTLETAQILQELEIRYYEVAKFDLTVTINDSAEILTGSFNYATELFDLGTINNFILTYQSILQQFSDCITNRFLIKQLHYCEQIQTIPSIVFPPIFPFSVATSIRELFEHCVLSNPTQIALVFKDQVITYLELNQLVNNLAYILNTQYNVTKDVLVAICASRSANTIIGMLAVLKSGGAYVPIDPSYPDERIAYILEDTGTSLILTDKQQEIKLKDITSQFGLSPDIMPLDNNKDIFIAQAKLELPNTTNANDLAYVIYTSGTTGKPKGVMLEQQSVINYLHNVRAKVFVDQNDRVDFSTNLGFDLTVTCTLGALCCGNSVYIYTDDVRDVESYKKHLLRHQINIVKLVPSYFDLLCDILPISNLKCAILGGEKLPQSLINKIPAKISIIDEYGPTETTVGACYYQFYPGSSKIKHNIGKAYTNYKLYILDEFLRQVPIGGIGELYIGGIAVARGYLNQNTNTSFIPDPFQKKELNRLRNNDRIYKSGDLVRCLPDYSLEYIGRSDTQVKINGFRIELEEIATKLNSYPLMDSAVVVVKTNKVTQVKYLAAYYVSTSLHSSDKLLGFLRQYLPDYMVPTVLVQLPHIPLTLNGKLDERALPEVDAITEVEYIEPTNPIQIELVKIFAKLLSLEIGRTGVNTDFFANGGNSILAIKLTSQVQIVLNKKIKVADIFIHKTVKNIAKLIQDSSKYEFLVKLTPESQSKEYLFMIHPAVGGCEVYLDLASKLQQFNCYGIDSYNLYNTDKISDLRTLAKLYLAGIDEVMLNSKQESYSFLGWSLGGQIALEIAYLLEQRGQTKIKVILLDTVLADSQMLAIREAIDQKEFKAQFFNYMLSLNHEVPYIEKIMLNLDTEFGLFKYAISGSLSYSKILLLKAMQEDQRYSIPESRLMDRYVLSLPHNNVEKFLTDKSQLSVFNLQQAHHGNILTSMDVLPLILSWEQSI